MNGISFGSVRAIASFAILLFSCWHANAAAADVKTHVHKSGVFAVMATSGKMQETNSDVQFTRTMVPFGSITGWDGVSFVMPELSLDRSDAEVMSKIIFETAENTYKSIKRKKDRPTASIIETMATEVLGRRAYYAKVLYPRYPGTGLTVFNQKGKQEDADFVAYLHLVSIDELGLLQRNLPIRYLLVTSLRAESLTPKEDNSHLVFLNSLRLLNAPGYVRGQYTGQYGFGLSIPDTRVAYGSIFSTEGVDTETLFIFPDGTALEKIADEQLFESLAIIRFEAMLRDNGAIKITLENTRTLVVGNLQTEGESFNIVDLDLPMPAFKVTITEPFPLVQVFIEAEKLLFVISAGRDDDILQQIISSLMATNNAKLEES